MANSCIQYLEYTEELEKSQEGKAIIQTVYQSKRSIWVSSLLAIVTPIAPYIYTQRWKTLGIFIGSVFSIAILLVLVTDKTNLKKKQLILSPLAITISALDNNYAIYKARKKLKETA